jgi:glycerophosphoryl diester phosphodiesterase
LETLTIDYEKKNHQITIKNDYAKKETVKKAHDNGMTVGVYFLKEPENHYDLFEIGVDVIITDYPIKVANQLKEYYYNTISCSIIKKTNILNN